MHTEIMGKRLKEYLDLLEKAERSVLTRKQYEREIRYFLADMGTEPITKESVIAYKEKLQKKYQPVSVNVKIAALNGFFNFIQRTDLKVSLLKIQKKVYCLQERELTKYEYLKLINAARDRHDERLSMILQTIGGTGIRVSELCYITVEAVRRGEAVICLKGKTRTILIARKLRKKLQGYLKREKIKEGPIFVTRNHKPLDRSNIWKMMKKICAEAGVDKKKVFPHNLRHLFARRFYDMDKDIAKLADILGHSNINTTRIYIISSGWEHSRKLDALGLVV